MILFRKNIDDEEEQIARKYFQVVNYRSEIPPNSLIIPRYSALPFYHELEKDVTNLGSKLINSHNQHQLIANFDYYEVLEKYTFKTYFSLQDIIKLPDTPLVVKGKTNSLKHSWNRRMFAKNKEEAKEIYFEFNYVPLQKDTTYHLVLNCDNYTYTDGAHMAWRKGWPDPVYGKPVSFGSLLSSQYIFSIVSAPL
jgi:hypothetical protein